MAPFFSRRWLAFALIGVVAACLHQPILTSVAMNLVADTSSARVTAINLFGDIEDSSGYDIAVKLLDQGPATRILTFQGRHQNTTLLGIEPTHTELDRRELSKRGIPLAKHVVLQTTANDEWQRMRTLGEWLEQNPDQRVCVVCREFASGRLARIARRVMRDQTRERIAWYGMPDRRFSATNWWCHKQGWLSLFGAYVLKCRNTIFGEAAHDR